VTDKEALKLALEKVANALPAYIEGTPAREYLAVIHSALAAPVQEPVDGTQVSKVWWDGKKLMAKPIPLEDIYQPVDWKAEYLKSVESGCITLDELREANAELAATNRQVEILSDALAESRREVASLKANAALDKKAENARALGLDYEPVGWWDSKIGFFEEKHFDQLQPLYTTPPAAQRPFVGLTHDEFIDLCEEASNFGTGGLIRHIEAKLKLKNTAAQPAVPDAFGTREGEHPQYIQGWNDCRAEMLKGMK